MSTANRVQVSVGSLADMGNRFAGAWNRAVAGEQVAETHVTFLNVQTDLAEQHQVQPKIGIIYISHI